MIRKIIIGINPKDAMAYYVGMKIGESRVSMIEMDERLFHNSGRMDYVIYITDDQGTMAWKRVSNMPVIVEYDCNF